MKLKPSYSHETRIHKNWNFPLKSELTSENLKVKNIQGQLELQILRLLVFLGKRLQFLKMLSPFTKKPTSIFYFG